MDSDDEFHDDEGFAEDLDEPVAPSTGQESGSRSGRQNRSTRFATTDPFSAMDHLNQSNIGGSNLGGLLGALAGGRGMGFGGHAFARPPASAFAKNYRAYSTAILEVKQGRGDRTGGRSNVMHGGKIIMPQEALLEITDIEMESPFMFEVRNTASGMQNMITHCGVLEFIADPGTVHLPQWMMTQLQLNEGDPIKLTGVRLPKGRFAKVQAQSPLFLELSDHKAVLESALRNFSCLTKGDIIEIYHNMMTFELLIMELKPDDAPAVSIFETDLEIDFATPKGYIEPAPMPVAPIPTMASRLQINTLGTQKVSVGQTTTNVGGEDWEAFKGGGRTMAGKVIKGKGVGKKKIEGVEQGSRIWRTDRAKIVTSETAMGDRHVPAALDLPYGTLFFGFNVSTFEESKKKQNQQDPLKATISHQAAPSSSSASNTTNSITPAEPSSSSSSLGTQQNSTQATVVAFSGQGHSLGSGILSSKMSSSTKAAPHGESIYDPIEID